MRVRDVVSAGILAALGIVGSAHLAAAQDWPPVTDEEKALKDCPQQPGAPAVFLNREETTSHRTWTTSCYYRLKILTSAGRERANIEVPAFRGWYKVADLKARVVRPDGTSVPFNGQVFDKTVLRTGGIKVTVKTIALPEVDVGSIIDYRYRLVPDNEKMSGKDQDALEELFGQSGKPEEGGIDTAEGILFFPVATWDVQADLFTRRARFGYEPSQYLGTALAEWTRKVMIFSWVTRWLPGAAPSGGRELVQLELANIPAFEPEELMPPEGSQRQEVRLFYVAGTVGSPDVYWREESENWRRGLDKFMGKTGTAPAEARKTVAGLGDPEAKIRALYERAQKIKNELRQDEDRPEAQGARDQEQPQRRRRPQEQLRAAQRHHQDLRRPGRGGRPAGPDRARVRPGRQALRAEPLRSLHPVRYGAGRDPGRRDGPFLRSGHALLPAGAHPLEMHVHEHARSDQGPAFRRQGARENAGRHARAGPHPARGRPPDGRRRQPGRNGHGPLRGTGGTEAAARPSHGRCRHREERPGSGVGRAPAGGHEDRSPEPGEPQELRGRCRGRLRCHRAPAGHGRRRPDVLPVSPLFGVSRDSLRHAQRKLPLSFPYPYRESDDIVISLPEGTKVEAVPAPRSESGDWFDHSLSCAVENGTTLHVRREVTLKRCDYPAALYGSVRTFFDRVRAADEEPVMLSPAKK